MAPSGLGQKLTPLEHSTLYLRLVFPSSILPASAIPIRIDLPLKILLTTQLLLWYDTP